MPSEYDVWVSNAEAVLREQYGLSSDFSSSAALLILFLTVYGLNPVVTSGWRSPEKQAELLTRYNAGDPSVRYKPAERSKHMNTDWLGHPASLAIDISTSDPVTAAEIARYLGIKPGNDFGDPVHFYI